MGRRPHPLIEQFFDRGAKLKDNSNRYRYKCKACGEWNEKGRYDSLIKHITKICPAMTEAERINVCLAHHGIKNGSNPPMYDGLLHSGPNTGPPAAQNAGVSQVHAGSQAHELHHTQSQAQNAIWTPLETLAEVSRQIEASEKHDDHVTHDPTTEAIQTTLAAAIPNISASGANHFELQEQFTLENPPLNYNGQPQQEKRDTTPQRNSEFEHHGLSAEEQRLQQLLQSATSPSQTALSVAAAAATARLSSSLLDPHLLSDAAIVEQIAQAAPATEMDIDYPEHEREPDRTRTTSPPVGAANAVNSVNSMNTIEHSTPWDGMTMTYMAEDIHVPTTVADHAHQLGSSLNKGGYRMDTTTSANGPRHRHSRARFESSRRREVQEVRRIGACIRCRILRKTCSKGTPCDTCKKVLSPRVWRTGCVRTKLAEYIDLYSAGVQVVMVQQRINGYKTSYHLENTGVVVEASHFPETRHCITFQVFQGYPKDTDEDTMKIDAPKSVILLDNDKEDIPGKVEGYMRHMLPEYIAHEPSRHVRITLEIADRIAKQTNDELLKRSLELWGIVEMMDRERQWTMLVKSPQPGVEDHLIKDDTANEAYSNICMQLTAAAERKASIASKNLLGGIQRILQDGKTKLGFPMFLTVMLFLNCLEKTTWAFKAWDQENLRPKWPLERPPSNYTNQGHRLTELLRMLLVIRHILPKTMQSEPDMPITAEHEGPIVKKYFEDLNITPRFLQMRYNQNNFQPTDSRSLEFLFCAQLLLNSPTIGSTHTMPQAPFPAAVQVAGPPQDVSHPHNVAPPQDAAPTQFAVPSQDPIPPRDAVSPKADRPHQIIGPSQATSPAHVAGSDRIASPAHVTDPSQDSATDATKDIAQADSQEVSEDV